MLAALTLTVKYIFYPVVIGMVSTVCYVILFDKLLKKIILPWYFSHKYKSTLIGGKWKGHAKNFTFDMILRQTGDRVNGEMVVSTVEKTPAKDGKAAEEKIIDTNSYTLEGEIRDGFVRIVHQEKDRNSFGFGCLLFQIAGGGKVLNGSVLFVDESEDGYSIATEEGIKLERI